MVSPLFLLKTKADLCQNPQQIQHLIRHSYLFILNLTPCSIFDFLPFSAVLAVFNLRKCYLLGIPGIIGSHRFYRSESVFSVACSKFLISDFNSSIRLLCSSKSISFSESSLLLCSRNCSFAKSKSGTL